jgi:hypothetical protein
VGVRRLAWIGRGFEVEMTPAAAGRVDAVDLAARSVTVTSDTTLPLGEALRGQVVQFLASDVPSAVRAPYVIDRVEPADAAHRYTLRLADPPTFRIAVAPVTGVDAPANTITIAPGTITRTAHRFLDGKRARPLVVRRPEQEVKDRAVPLVGNGRRAVPSGSAVPHDARPEELYLVTGYSDGRVSFGQEGAAAAFQAGTPVEFYDLGVGDQFELIGTAEVVRMGEGRYEISATLPAHRGS